MIGGLRWQEMARLLAEEGWAVDVIARDFDAVAGSDPKRLDPSRLQRLPRGVRVYSVPDREPVAGRLQKTIVPLVRRLRGSREQPRVTSLSKEEVAQQGGTRALLRAYFSWLQFAQEGNWANGVARLGAELVRTQWYAAVISSGPPHMSADAARRIAHQASIPFLMDLRDPWSLHQRLAEFVASPVWFRLARKHERRAVRAAALVTMNTEGSRDAMRLAYPQDAPKIHVIRNGCDDDPLPPTRRDGCFRIRFAGSVYADRDPRLLFRAAARVIRDLGLSPQQFAIELIGFVSPALSQTAADEGVGDHVRLGALVPRKEAAEFLAGATMLLSLPMAEEEFSLPAKIYEYMRFSAWMLVLAHDNSASARLLVGTDADVVDPSDMGAIATVLKRRYEQFANGIMPAPVRRDARFDRPEQVKKLLTLLARVTSAQESRAQRDDAMKGQPSGAAAL